MWKRINETSPILARFLLFVCAPLGLAAAAGYGQLRQSVPDDGGLLTLRGDSGAVRLESGAGAVPRIEAASEPDAYFALGYAHARDRLWQMEYQKLIGQGRLSELRGAATLALDRYLRTLGLRQAAEQALAQLSPRARALLEAYVRGVNARIAERRPLAPEYYLNGRQPEPWTAADSLLQLKLLQISLDDSGIELRRQAALVRQLGGARAAQLLRADGGRSLAAGAGGPEPDGELLRQLEQAATRLHAEFGVGAVDPGSSAWAVDGRYTASGKPALVNDLHAVSLIPSKWYVSELAGGATHLAGATIPGLPLFFAGRNDSISWGPSVLRAYSPRLAAEQTDPLDSDRYRDGGQWRRMDSRVEIIRVKGEFPSYLRGGIRPLRLTVRSTVRGPVVSDLAGAGAAYSLALPGLAPQDRSFDALLALNQARDWGQFKAALSGHASPALVMVYADRAGNIGAKAAARLPYGSEAPGLALPGGGRGDIAYGLLPESFNPPGGIVLQAGNQERADRIAALLGATGAARSDSSALLGIQRDDRSLGAETLAPLLLATPAADARQRQALDYLRRWDGRAAPDSVAASIYNVWVDCLFRDLVYANAADRLAVRPLLDSYPAEARVRFLDTALGAGRGDWCTAPGRAGACGELLARSLQAALQQLRLAVGHDMAGWRWDAVQQAAYRNPAAEPDSLAAGLLDRRGPAIGDGYGVAGAAPAVAARDGGYRRLAGSDYLQVIDLGADGGARFLLSTGQSGNVLSPRYDDYLKHAGAIALRAPGFGAPLEGTQALTLTALPGKPE
ncbi:penicillin acylase family protein [Oxalobacteraceae bacterium A2-2]